MQVGPAVQTSAAHPINAATSKIMARNRIGNAVAAMRSDRRAPVGGAHTATRRGSNGPPEMFAYPHSGYAISLACPSTVVALIEPIEQEVDAVRLHALGDREVVDPITSL